MAEVPKPLPEQESRVPRAFVAVPSDTHQSTRDAAEDMLRIEQLHGVRGPLLRMPFRGTTSAYFDHVHSYYDQLGNDVRLARHLLTRGSAAQAKELLKQMQPGQREMEEYVLAASLHEQRNIAAAFGLPASALCKVLKLDYSRNAGDGIMDSYFNVYMRTFLEKMRLLRSEGFQEEDLIHEVAGYAFHETLHSPGDSQEISALLKSDRAIGEVTPITGELAYHLLSRHRRSLFTIEGFEQRGLAALRNGDNTHQKHEHMRACAIAYKLLRNRLSEAFPLPAQLAANMHPDSAACWSIRDAVTASEETRLTEALKGALADSANTAAVKTAARELAA